MDERFMIDCGHWGMFPAGYNICAEIRPGAGPAVHIRTDETGKILDSFPQYPSIYNDMARQFMANDMANQLRPFR